MRLFFPLKIGVSGGIFSEKVRIGEGETGGTSSEDIDTAAVDLINSGTVTFQITNGLPIGIQVSTRYLDLLDNDPTKFIQLFDIPKATEPAIQVDGGLVDAQGRVTTPAFSVVDVNLAPEDIDKFIDSTEVIEVFIQFATSGGGTTPVQFRTSDAVSVRAHAILSVRVDPDSPGLGGEGISRPGRGGRFKPGARGDKGAIK